MPSTRVTSRVLPDLYKTSRGSRFKALQSRHLASRHDPSPPEGRRSSLRAWVLTMGFAFGLGVVSSRKFTLAYAETLESTGKDISAFKENIRDRLSSQRLQVKESWENPGVYAWGSNSGKVVAPDSDEEFIKAPRRIPFFDGVLLRDLKLDRNFGAAITENGDLLQWGAAYSKDNTRPTPTLKGKNLLSLELSRDRIIALSSDGKIYSVPVSKEDQAAGSKSAESSWIPFWSVPGRISYRLIRPKGFQWGEKVLTIRGGLDHVLLLTSKGRLFSAASSGEFPSKGQLGVSGLTWNTRPAGPYDQPHEVTTLRGFDIVDIAAGDYHSLALDRDGRVFAFGDNSLGQLGFDYNAEATTIDTPSLLPIQKLYQGSNAVPRVTGVAAGGSNSFFTVDTTHVDGQGQDSTPQRGLSRITSDTFSCGQGIWGGLGNGRWTHVQGTPTKIKALSGLSEWNETTDKVTPIRLAHISVGSTHAAAVMKNVTRVSANDKTLMNGTHYGADVLWWGGNQFYQLGTGKRNNLSSPGYLAPLDGYTKGRTREHRLQVAPRKCVKINGREVNLEQRVECGRNVSAVYSGV